ncbi:hypothetical protein NPIL_17971, partial [Nephila pilipes]
MESENESLQDQDMSSNASSSRASTPSIPEHFHSACLRRKLIEQELKTYTDSIDHTEILMKNLERQGLLDHPIYTNHRTMIHGLRRQRDLLSGLTKKDDPEFLRIHDELRKAGENLDKVLANLGDIPLFKLPASEKELDAMTLKPPKTASTQVNVIKPIAVVPLSQDRSDSASQGKKSNKRTRDSEGFISPPKHLTRKAPKANPNVDKTDDAPTPDPDVDVNILDPVGAKTHKTNQSTNNTGSAKQPIRKQPPPPPCPDISGYRKVEPTLQYSAALRGETTERPRATLPPPPTATGDARFNA